MLCHCSVNRLRFFAAFLVVWTLFTAQGASADDRSPVAVLAAASVDRLLEDFRQLRGVEETGKISAVADQVQGIDRSQPFGVFLFLKPDEPGQLDAVASIPVSDIQQLQTTCRNFKFLSLDPEQGDLWTLNIGGHKVPARLTVQRLELATRAEQLADSGSRTRLLGEVLDQFDLAARIDIEALPGEERTEVLSKFESDLDRDAARKQDEKESDFRIRQAILALVRQVGRRVIEGTGRLDFGFKLGSGIQFSGTWQGIPGTDLAIDASILSRDVAQWRSASTPTALRARLAVTLPSWFADGLSHVVTEIQTAIEQEFGKSLSAADLSTALGIFDSLLSTLASKHFDANCEFVPTADEHLAFLAGLTIEKADRTLDALAIVLPYVEHDEGVQSIDFGIVKNATLTMHRIVHKEFRRRDEQLYGPQPGGFVGTSQRALLLAVGGASTPEILSTSREETVEAPALISVEVSLKEWFDLAARERPNSRKIVQSRKALSEINDDDVHFRVTATDVGIHWSLEADEGLLKVLELMLPPIP